MLSIVPVSSLTVSNSFLNSCSISSTSVEISDMELAVVTRLSSSFELVVACPSDSVVRSTILLIRDTTF